MACNARSAAHPEHRVFHGARRLSDLFPNAASKAKLAIVVVKIVSRHFIF
jgi:hypothetical protein